LEMDSSGSIRILIRLFPGTAGALLLLMLLLLPAHPAGAQEEPAYHVKWIGMIPEEPGAKAVSIGDRVSRIVFGQKPRELIKPFNLVALNPEQLWILDQGSGGIYEVDRGRGGMIRSLKRERGTFPSMVGICRTPGGDLLFTDSRLNRVVRLSEEGVQYFSDTVVLDQPTGIACNPKNGDIWVVETGAHRISRFSPEGKPTGSFGGRGSGEGLFNYPTFICIDGEGRIYVVDSMNYRIQILDEEGRYVGSFGEAGDATGYMARPKGVATDSRGHIYVADALFHVVQIFDRQGRFLDTFGSQGQGEGEFWMPAGLYIDDRDRIYVADSYNARIQIFQLENDTL
jgi:DNA-binding beta-propeller fold protein YncE